MKGEDGSSVTAMSLRPNSQNARIIAVLADKKWHTTVNIQRRSGATRLNSRMAELRKRGFDIESEVIHGQSGRLGHRYRLANPPAPDEVARIAPPITSGKSISRDTPRTRANRFRIYRMAFDQLELVATATTPSMVGEKIYALGIEGIFKGSCLGVLDTHGMSGIKGDWIVDPFDNAPL